MPMPDQTVGGMTPAQLLRRQALEYALGHHAKDPPLKCSAIDVVETANRFFEFLTKPVDPKVWDNAPA